ncbi:type IV pilus secretin PilQ [Aliagarivorans taiwanensis]|uniref:type IV pilus secretin PilQ n=1 Tax=Aliagarivorans taiwanensis TaxID=561966 RepID=UPI00042130EA|nr:type IV pilus secretin PilQ family protein [Aliagarivorans taiwanensis]
MNGMMLKKWWNRVLGLSLVMAMVSSVQAAQLTEVKTQSLANGVIELLFQFDGQVTGVSDQLAYAPNQIVLSIPEARSALSLNPVPLNFDGLQQLTTERKAGLLSVEIGLDKLMPYQLKNEGDALRLLVGAPPQADFTSRSTEQINQVVGLDFRRGKQGSGQLMISLNNRAIAADIERRDQSLTINLFNTGVSSELLYIMDVVDFATPVQQVEVFEEPGKVMLVMNVDGEFDYRYDQSESLLMVEVKAVEEKVSEQQQVYQGKPISLNFQDIPVRTVLQLIADFNQFNLVTTDTVSGNITLRMDNVPWEQALDIILKVKGLDKRLENNVLLVAPAAELAEQERQQLESAQQVAELAPLYSEYMQINYAKAVELANLLQGDQVSLLSERGSVAVDERTNTLLVKDTEQSLASIKQMLDKLDVPVKQVVIEARMVTVADDVNEELGIRWGVTNNADLGNSTGITSGTLEGANNILSDVVNGTTTSLENIDDRLNVNLPVQNPAGTLAFQVAQFANGQILDLELSALEQENKGEVIASPRITTANQKPAYIEQGREIPYVEASSSGATSVTFKKAVLGLKVTPQITPDGNVILDLVITQNSEGDAVQTPTGLAVAIDTQEIATQVLVKNGETIVLGGIYQQESVDRVTKVPVLGDIPGFGFLFRNTVASVSKRELLIFVTPRILVDAL